MTSSSPTPTLADRYVFAVLRHVPSGDRPELEREVRALIADAIEAKTVADPSLDTEAAERAALTELGEPGALASQYSRRINYLLGPMVYPVWLGLVRLVLAVLIPLIAFLAVAGSLIAGGTIGQAIFAGIAGAFQVAVQSLFWFTLVFAVLERFDRPVMRAELSAAALSLDGSRRGSGEGPWTVDDLPALPDQGRIGLGELAATIVASLFFIGTVLWLQLASPIVVNGESISLFDPVLWSFWLPWFIVVWLLDIVLMVAVYRHGHWTHVHATVHAVLSAAFAVPAIYLLANDLLFNPAFVDAAVVATDGTATWIQPTKVIIGVSIAAIGIWAGVDGFLKARRASAAARLG
jgi:hypothetical protein